MLIATLLQIFGYLISIATTLLIVQFVISLLMMFNVINMSNQFVASLWHGLNVLLDPLLKPIRRFMPNTGAMDFSPMVLFILLKILEIIVGNLAIANATTGIV